MNLNTSTIPAAIGAAFGGGFYSGSIKVGDDTYALILAPKVSGEFEGKWNASNASVAGAEHYSDGYANTQAMAAAGSTLAASALALDIDGHADWYLPSRDELELIYRHLKPTTEENCESFRDGDNPSSTPVGYPYTASEPGQTVADAFKAGGGETLEPVWHWSSTQYAPDPITAWLQYFGNGGQHYGLKSAPGRARAVRRLKI